MGTIPEDQTAEVLLRLSCSHGHQWTAYGVDETNYWAPPSCVKCGRPLAGVEKVADLSSSPRHRYEVTLWAPSPKEAADWPYVQQVCADRFESSSGATTFFVAEHAVAHYRRLALPPVMVS
jgi:hypothetical protein